MADQVELTFRRAANRLLPRDARVLAAVSGGGDSVALLHLLHRFAAGQGLSIVVGHLDHGLRRGSRAERIFVERLARELSLPCVSDRREVGQARRKDESPEEAARRVRRRFLMDAATKTGAALIATGHTLDDQAETVLMRLVRGAGATALAGMAERGPGRFVRPLLHLERQMLRRWLQRRRVSFREDPSNRDLRFDRNRVRRLVLPVVQETLNPRAARHLVKAAKLLREDACYLDTLAETAFHELCRTDRAGHLLLDVDGLSRAAPPIAQRIVRLALRRAGVDGRRVVSRHVEALLALGRRGARGEIHLPGRTLARRAGQEIVLRGE